MIELDRESLLAHVRGATLVAELERRLAPRGLTLGLREIPGTTVAQWIADGAPGAAPSWDDPADHLVAGFSAHFPDGRLLEVRPAPRRSVGPDLFALVLGQKNRFMTLVDCWLRVHLIGVPRPRVPFLAPAARAPEEGELRLLDAIARELSARS